MFASCFLLSFIYYHVVIFVQSAPIFWYSKRQATIESSTYDVRLYCSRPIVLDRDFVARLTGYRSLCETCSWFRSVVQDETKVPNFDKLWCVYIWTGAVVIDGYEASVTDWIGSATHDCAETLIFNFFVNVSFFFLRAVCLFLPLGGKEKNQKN